jgi:hypothetical protein
VTYSPGVPQPPRHRVAASLLRHRVVVVGVALVVLQLVFRGWALSRSWFLIDDLAFMSRAFTQPMDLAYLTESYAGHLMPGGFALSWWLSSWAPYEWLPWAAVLLALQAVASLGMLRLLVSMFGPRPFILVPLTLFLAMVTTLPSVLWWAAGINQLPLLVALVLGLHAHLAYLRRRRTRDLALTLLWTAFGLAFYEKTLLVFGVYGLVALAYFAHGDLQERLVHLWQRYRTGIIAHLCVAGGYVVLYLQYGFTTESGNPDDEPWAPLVYRLVLRAFAPALVGGPLRWQDIEGPGAGIADPSQLTMLVSWAAVAGVVWYAHRTRTMSARAWSLPGLVLLADAVLLIGARVLFTGPDVALEYRYQTEVAAVVAVALGLAFLPLRGAPEVNAVREGASTSYERPAYVAAGIALVALLATVSSRSYVDDLEAGNPTPQYIRTVQASLADATDSPVPMVDGTLPVELMWAYRYPENTYSHVLEPFTDDVRFVTSSTDRLFVFDQRGELSPVLVPPVREEEPARGRCPYEVDRSGTTTIPLNGPVTGGGWWIRMGYFVEGDAVGVTVRAGDDEHELVLQSGLHSAFFTASGDFDEVTVRRTDGGRRACVTDLQLGIPEAAGSAS